jgi:hypothetical protein
MANEVKKAVEEKEESSGLGALIGFTAAAAIPFLRPFRNLSKAKRAFDTINSSNAARTTATETLLPKMLPAPKGGGIAAVPTKIKYDLVPRQPQIEPLINDRAEAFKAVRGVPLDEQSPQLLFGSSLYDQVKLFPKDKARADDWLNMFKQKQNVKYSDGRSASIDAEELFDANIAAFDKSGNLTGGLLKAAKDLNIEVDKNLLLKQVQLNPFNQLALSKYKMPKGLEENKATLINSISKARDYLSNKYTTTDNTTMRNMTNMIYNDLDDSVKSLSENLSGLDIMVSRNFIKTDVNRAKTALKDALKQVSDPQDKQMLNDTIRVLNGTSEEILTSLSGKVKIPTHIGSEYGTYRLPGESNPGEFVWHFPRAIDRNLKNSGYHWDDAQQPVVHAMYGTRYTPKGEKVFSINEIQADVNQKVLKDMAGGKVRMNPFGKDTEKELLAGGLQPLRDKIDSVVKKGIYATDKELYEMNKAMQTLRGSRNSMRGQAALSNDATTDYMPFLNTKNYNDLALKTIIKEAADDGAQWVSVVPANAMSRGNGIVPGNELAYGYSNGSGVGQQGKGILPELMKKLANQYKTEAKTIQVALSDPNKPYKIIVEKEVVKYSSKGGNRIGSEKVKHHQAAFDTEAEALRFIKRQGQGEHPIEFIAKDDPTLYMNMYALKITPDMLNKPMKLYKHEGGLINNVFTPL